MIALIVALTSGRHRDASGRDGVGALVPDFFGLRDSEVAGLDVEDVRLSARKGELRVLGKGANGGQAAHAPRPRRAAGGPGGLPLGAPALGRGQRRLSARPESPRRSPQQPWSPDDQSAASVLAGIRDGPLDSSGPVPRHTFGTLLVRARVDLVSVTELMSHARLEKTRIYTLPTKADPERALDVVLTDR